MSAQVNPRTGMVLVSCGECGWNAGGTLVMVDRWITDYPPIPYVKLIEFYRDGFGDPDDRVNECPICFAEIAEDIVVETNVRTAHDVLSYLSHVESWLERHEAAAA
jgi:hypothetical protein